MASQIQLRRDTAANWLSVNPILAQGELGVETDTGRMKLGNGVDSWDELAYNPFAASLNDLTDVTITNVQNGDFLRYNNSASVWINDPVNLATDTVGDYVQSLVAGTGLTITNNSGEGSTPTLAIGQAVGTSASVTFAQVSLTNSPVSSNHAVTKQYVDAIAAGINWHLSVKLATATILSNLPNYNNGTDGVGATLTATQNGRLSIDGVNATTNDRVLIKNQSDAKQNGIYLVSDQGSASAVYILTRATDFDGFEDNVVRGDACYIGSGSVNGNQGFVVSSTGTGAGTEQHHEIGTDDIVFAQFTGTANIIAGTGITKTGNTLSIGQDVATSASVTFARVYGEFTGNSDTATTLATPRNIQLTGAVTGTVPFNGSSNVEILATMNSTLDSLTDVSASAPGENTFLKWVSTGWEPDVINLGTDTTGNYMVDLTQGTGVTITHTPGEGSNATIAIGQNVGTSASVTFGQVTATLLGNATSATTLQTSRNIAGQAFNGSADISIAPTDLTGVTATASEINTLDGITASTAELNILDGVTASAAELNVLDGITSSTAELNILDGVTASASELNILDGATLSTTELNYVDGVTSAIQTQIDAKAPTNSPTFTGTVTLPNNTVALGTQTTGDYVSSLVAGTGLTITNNSGEGATPTVAIGQSVATSASPTFGSLSTTGALYVGTDIHVGGVYYTTTETNLAIEDSFVYLNDGNTVSDPDLGFAGNYNDGTYRHAGVFSDASDSHKFKFFKGYTPEPTNPINTSHASYTHADVIANTFESKVATGTAPFTVASTTVVTNLNADLLDGNSSTYFLNGTTSVLDDISNVSASAPSNGQFLKYNGTAWVPDSIPTINALDDIGNVTAPSPTSGDFLKWNGSAWVNASGVVTTSDSGTVTSTMIADATIVNGDISASAGIALSKLATSTAGNIIVYNSSGVPTAVAETGDITISDTGVTAIASGVIVNADISASAAIELGKLADVSTNAQTASYTLVLADKNKVVEMGVGSANNLTVPLNSSQAFPVGSQINILQTGSGQTTIVATGGVTINATPGLKMRAQWSYATLIKRATDTWVLVGDISA
jgi:hypothetical protein